LLAGLISDASGEDGLAVGLAWSSGLYLWSAIHFVLAARTLPQELARTRTSA
jgi:hypothetical protein